MCFCQALLAFAAGGLLGDVFLHSLPHLLMATITGGHDHGGEWGGVRTLAMHDNDEEHDHAAEEHSHHEHHHHLADHSDHHDHEEDGGETSHGEKSHGKTSHAGHSHNEHSHDGHPYDKHSHDEEDPHAKGLSVSRPLRISLRQMNFETNDN
jgi:hypothetical protein